MRSFKTVTDSVEDALKVAGSVLKQGLAEVPCIVVDLPPDKLKAYRIADNKASEFAERDPEKLKMELRELPEVQSLAAFFQGDELDRMMQEVSTLNTNLVTRTDVQREQDRLNDAERRRGEETAARFVETICPHCREVYYLDRAEFAKAVGTPTVPDGATVVSAS